jgi:hypothetical protein
MPADAASAPLATRIVRQAAANARISVAARDDATCADSFIFHLPVLENF